MESKRAESTDCCCDGSCGEPNEVSRRQFLQSTGVGLTALSIPALARPIMAGPFTRRQPEGPIDHFVPVDKKLAPDWIASLTQRGARRVYRGDELKYVAMPIGGIAAGQLYLRGDGTLSCWQIFNQQYFSGYGRDNYDLPPSSSPVEQGFAVVLDEADNPVYRLSKDDFPDVEFAGRYPVGRVRYVRADCPVSIEMEAFSPFIPLNAADSSLPATVFHITVGNQSDRPVGASILTWLENAVCSVNAPYLRARRISRVRRGANCSVIEHSVEPMPKNKEPVRPAIVFADFEGTDYGDWTVEGEAFGTAPAHGTLSNQQHVSGFVGQGLVNTFLRGDGTQGMLTSPEFTINRHFINFMIGGGAHANQTCINLNIDGRTVRTATGKNQETLRWDSWDVREFAGRKALIVIVDANTGGWGHVNIDQIEFADESRFGAGGPLEELEDFGTMALAYEGGFETGQVADGAMSFVPGPEDVSFDSDDLETPVNKRNATTARTSGVTLAPGEARMFTFVLAWHIPNRPDVGQQYANRFSDATAVARYVLDNHDRLTDDTRLWVRTFYEDATLPHWLLERLHIPVCNLATGTCQWWKDGRFWAWEGVGCCSGTCTHVWNYEHAMAHLFPALERSARTMQDLGAALHDNGLVGFRGQRNGAYAADGQAGTILKCYREHLMSADNGFLQANWPSIKKVLLFSVQQDANDDGVIENSQHNTYDIEFFGPNTFVGSLYLAALRAGEEMARLVGDHDFADRLHRIFERGRDATVAQLFNGEYFIQQVDLKEHPQYQYAQGCLSDQLFGQGWARQLHLGDIYPIDKVQTTLQSIWKYNWAPDIRAQNEAHHPERWFARAGEAGLFTCTWPRSPYLADAVRYRNEVWTGIEYQVAGNMIYDGMLTEGLAICRAIHDRYDPTKRNPYNEVECGDHYARAMASWGVYTALCGFEYDGPRGHIGFAPRLQPGDFSAAFTAAKGWGRFTQTISARAQECAIDVRWGDLDVSTIVLQRTGQAPDAASRVSISLAGRPIRVHSISTNDGRIAMTLGDRVTVSAGQSLDIRIT